MKNLPLPPELERIEQMLLGGPRPVPSAALRRRVREATRRELHRAQMRSRWRLCAALAAALVVGVSLLFGARKATSIALQQRPVSPSVQEVAGRLQQFSARLSRTESLRQAMLRQIVTETAAEVCLDAANVPYRAHDEVLDRANPSNAGLVSDGERALP
jgi:hypothetical protein